MRVVGLGRCLTLLSRRPLTLSLNWVAIGLWRKGPRSCGSPLHFEGHNLVQIILDDLEQCSFAMYLKLYNVYGVSG